MAISGGRCRWARMLSFSVAGGMMVQLGLVGCGGRTSMLDGDLYGGGSSAVAGSGFGNGGSGVMSVGGASSSSGSGAVSSGGTVSLPGNDGGFAGNPTAAAGAPASVVSACSTYCPRYGTQCRVRLNGQDCLTACEGEMTGFGPSCQTLGLKALACLAPFFTINGGNCDAAVKSALGTCSKEVTAFNSCKRRASGGGGPPK